MRYAALCKRFDLDELRRDVLFQVGACVLGVVAFLVAFGCDGAKVTLTANVDGQGTVTLTPPGGSYDTGTTVTLTAAPADGWRFDRWEGDLTGSDNPADVTIAANTTITAVFIQGDPNTLVLNLGGGATIELIKIPAGSYEMGTEEADWTQLDTSRPVHTVTFAHPFYVGKYEVTRRQWNAVMLNDPTEYSGSDEPVVNVYWEDCAAFCQTLSSRLGRTVRLPSDAEWEYACKAGSGDTRYFFGTSEAELLNYAWVNTNSGLTTQGVGQKLPNPWGLYDILGNVFEWCQDVWNPSYVGAPADGSAWMTGNDPNVHVVRGGSWDTAPKDCRSALRHFPGPLRKYEDVGFRVAADVE
jgi:formylglycine-generating enzyme required for sulfatase activity